MREIESTYDLLNDRDALADAVENAESVTDVADVVGCTTATVNNWVQFHEIPIPDSWNVGTSSNIDVLNETEKLRSMIVDEKMSVREISETLDVSRDALRNWLLRNGVNERIDDPSRNSGSSSNHHYGSLETAAWAQTDVAWREKDQLIRAYWGYYWNMHEIADWAAYGPSRSLISDIMRDNDIPIRNESEAGTIRALKQHGASLERMREEVPPPIEMATALRDMDIEVYENESTRDTSVTVEWSRLKGGADG